MLAADGLAFDSTWRDFEVLDQAVTDVRGADPDGPVGILTKGRQGLTTLSPTDGAFRRPVADRCHPPLR